MVVAGLEKFELMYSLLNGTEFEGARVGLKVENPVTSWFMVLPVLEGTLKGPGVPVINALAPVVVVVPEAKLTPVFATLPAG